MAANLLIKSQITVCVAAGEGQSVSELTEIQVHFAASVDVCICV